MNTNRRTFLKLATPVAAADAAGLQTSRAAELRAGVPFIVDCQSHLFLPEVLALMRKRKDDPRVYDENGVTWLKMGDSLRKVPPHYTDITTKLAANDASGITLTLLSTNDPGPEWFGADGAAVAQVLNDSIAGIARRHADRFAGLCVLPLQDAAAAQRELDRCLNQLQMKGILLYTNLAGRWPDEPDFRWLFARAEELGVPLVLHPAKACDN